GPQPRRHPGLSSRPKVLSVPRLLQAPHCADPWSVARGAGRPEGGERSVGVGGTAMAERYPVHRTNRPNSEVLMGSRLTEIVVDCHDPVAQAAFWAAALGYQVVRTEQGQVEV